MHPPVYSAYPHFKSKTLSWLPMDTKELFLKNQSNKDTREKLEELNWTEDSIEYKFNSQGFRSDDFNSKGESIVFLGCSHTIGIGINFENTASYIVSRELGYNCFNLAQGGGSNDTCFRFAYHWIEKLSPKIVVLIAPNIYRVEIARRHGFDVLMPDCVPEELDSFYGKWIDSDNNANFNFQKNLFAIQKISHWDNGAKFVYTNCEFDFWRGEARDLAHAGKAANLKKSKELLDLIN